MQRRDFAALSPPPRRARRGGADGGAGGRGRRRDDRLCDAARQQALGEDADHCPHRGHFPEADPGRSGASGRFRGAVRRGARAQPRQRFRPRFGARRAGGAEARSQAARDVGDARRRALRRFDGQGAGDRERGARFPDRARPSRPLHRKTDRGRDSGGDPPGARRERRQPARFPPRSCGDRAHCRAHRSSRRRSISICSTAASIPPNSAPRSRRRRRGGASWCSPPRSPRPA